MEVKVLNNDLNKAMKVMKRKMQQEGLFRELKRRRFHEKPSDKKKRKHKEALSRERKRLRKMRRFA
ncbi:MAG: 30S ribosomal protein S21 [Nitrospinaceae bacterium]|nr:30S ribosomal protein S21 [Nitrospinaceae bacterium]